MSLIEITFWNNFGVYDRMDNFHVSLEGDDSKIGDASVEYDVDETMKNMQTPNPNFCKVSRTPLWTNFKVCDMMSMRHARKSRSTWYLMRKYDVWWRIFLSAIIAARTSLFARHPTTPAKMLKRMEKLRSKLINAFVELDTVDLEDPICWTVGTIGGQEFHRKKSWIHSHPGSSNRYFEKKLLYQGKIQETVKLVRSTSENEWRIRESFKRHQTRGTYL